MCMFRFCHNAFTRVLFGLHITYIHFFLHLFLPNHDEQVIQLAGYVCIVLKVVCRFDSSRFSLFLLGEYWRLDGVRMAFLFFYFRQISMY